MTVDSPRLSLNVLASGSKGNASIVTFEGRSILIDCGIGKRDFFARCETLGVDPAGIEAILITHEHTDHTKGIGVVTRGMSAQGISPTLMTSHAVFDASKPLGEVRDTLATQTFDEGDVLSIAGMQVLAFPTSHDAAQSFGFRFEAGNDAIGYVTDTGIITPETHEALQNVRILALESNHDLVMLHNGDYPYSLKQHVEGEFGHLSNDQACAELESLLSPRLEQVIAMHISENNNTFGIPSRAFKEVLARNDHPASVHTGRPRTPVSLI